ncbi:MAG: hypothetical protein LBH77_08630 [Tannerella sp.]|jgi:hypothetical protein|nr:hypothetical protein [Tannerella sp.]
MEAKFTEQESIEIITEMINRARNNVRKGKANSMIFNGYVAAIIAIANFILLQVLPKEYFFYSFYIWCLMFPVVIIDHFIDRKVDKVSIVKTEIDKIISSAWYGFTISTFAFIIVLLAAGLFFNEWKLLSVITPAVLFMVAIPEFITARACRFKPFFWGAIIFWLSALLCIVSIYVFKRADLQFIIFMISMVFGFIIPGHKLNKLADKTYV